MGKPKITTAAKALAKGTRKGEDLEYVPEHLKTEELCLIAVKQDAEALEYVPEARQEEVRRRLKSEEVQYLENGGFQNDLLCL